MSPRSYRPASSFCGAVLCAALLVTGFAGPGRGADPDTTTTDQRGVAQHREYLNQKRTRVILIGVNQCQDKQVQARKHAEADARTLAALFRDPDRFDAAADNVQLFLGQPGQAAGTKKATRANVLAALKTAVDDMGDGDMLIFGFFGQGATVGNSGTQLCYLLADSTLENRGKDALTDADLMRELGRVDKGQVCAFLDVTFNGFDGEKLGVPNPTREAYDFEPFLGRKRGQFLPGRALFFLGNGLTAPPDLKTHGVLAEALWAALDGDADRSHGEPDGLVTVKELRAHLPDKVAKLLKDEGPVERPELYAPAGALSDFPLVLNPDPAKEAEARLAKFEKVALARKLDAALVAEGRRLLGRTPRADAERKLRDQYKLLADGRLALKDFTENRDNILTRFQVSDKDAARFADGVFEVITTLDTGYVRKINEGELTGRAVEALFRALDEPMPEELEKEIRNIKQRDRAELKALLANTRKRFGVREEFLKDRDLGVAWNGMLGFLDSLSVYYSPEQKEQNSDLLSGNFVGIGVQIRTDPATRQLMVSTPIRNSPAHKAGLSAGDVIVSITRDVAPDGTALTQPETFQTKGRTTAEAIPWIRGKAGTPLTLRVLPAGAGPEKEFRVLRGSVEPETVVGATRKAGEAWNFMLAPGDGIGYARVRTFAGNTVADFRAALADLKEQKAKGLVLDLRFNLGGTLAGCRGVSELLVGKEVVYIQRDRQGVTSTVTGFGDAALDRGVPVVCLVNGETAAGAEIVASSLQDHGRGVIMGSRTAGAASIQNLENFHGGTLKYTFATFARPSGRNLDRANAGNKPDEWGVTPDKGFVLNLAPKDREGLRTHLEGREVIPRRDGKPSPKASDFKDEQLEMAVEYLKKQIR